MYLVLAIVGAVYLRGLLGFGLVALLIFSLSWLEGKLSAGVLYLWCRFREGRREKEGPKAPPVVRIPTNTAGKRPWLSIVDDEDEQR